MAGPTAYLQTSTVSLALTSIHCRSSASQRFTCIHGNFDPASRTQKIMESISGGSEVGGAGGASSYAALRRADEQWLQLRTSKPGMRPAPTIVHREPRMCLEGLTEEDVFDAVICGGTLGILLATGLALKGLKVAIVERGKLQGRVQEWNISRKELDELVKAGILTHKTVQDVIAADFNPNRCGFNGGFDVWVENILNLGVSPLKLIEHVKQQFLKMGGMIFEGAGLSKVNVFDDAVVLTLDNDSRMFSRLILDAMGNFSPIVRQMRWRQQPDGICLVVGTCARGYNDNSTSDIIYSNAPAMIVGNSKAQLFWEAFPAGSGPTDRTCYLFSYMDIKPERPSLEQMLDIYWDLMPKYQNVALDKLEILRVVFGLFPTYRSSPLPAAFDRVLQVGDASGIQSPISFGGFGSLTRHLGRLADGISESLELDLLDKECLSLLNPYMPNLSGSWLFQKAMSVGNDSSVSSNFINDLLATNFQCMQKLGDPVLRPFLQDVIQFGPLAKTLGLTLLSRPDLLPSIFRQVGWGTILNWTVHFTALGVYTILNLFATPYLLPWVSSLPKKDQYVWRRRFDAWKYGSGLDYQP